MNIPFVDLKAQYRSIQDEVNAEIAATLEKCDFILGQNVESFEKEFASFCGARYGIGVDSGTSALELALLAYDIGPGDEVITSANTFIATALAITYTGAKPVLVDIEPDSYMIDPDRLREAITERTKAIIPVHLYGHPADMDLICAIANEHDLVVIEDASQAHGARYRGERVGTFGDVAAFSLYPGKNLGAYGDAGVLVTDDERVNNQLRLLRNWGSVKKYHHEILGYNRRMDTLQSSILRVKLRHLEGWNMARRSHAKLYHQLLADSSLTLPVEASNAESVYHLYVIRTPERDKLANYLQERGVAAIIHYPVPIHLQPAYKELGHQAGDFPITEQFAQEILSLPIFPELQPEQIHYIAKVIGEFDAEHEPVALSAQLA